MRIWWLWGAILAVMGLVGPAVPTFAQDFYLKVTGTKQGVFKGEAAGAPWKDWSPGVDLEHRVQLPLDRVTGMANGMAQHMPLTVTKRLGAASPQFLQALTTNELLKQVDLSFVRTRPDGTQEVYYTITLRNATLAEVRLFRSPGPPEALPSGEYEALSFRYQSISVKSPVGGTEAMADWGTGGGVRGLH